MPGFWETQGARFPWFGVRGSGFGVRGSGFDHGICRGLWSRHGFRRDLCSGLRACSGCGLGPCFWPGIRFLSRPPLQPRLTDRILVSSASSATVGVGRCCWSGEGGPDCERKATTGQYRGRSRIVGQDVVHRRTLSRLNIREVPRIEVRGWRVQCSTSVCRWSPGVRSRESPANSSCSRKDTRRGRTTEWYTVQEETNDLRATDSDGTLITDHHHPGHRAHVLQYLCLSDRGHVPETPRDDVPQLITLSACSFLLGTGSAGTCSEPALQGPKKAPSHASTGTRVSGVERGDHPPRCGSMLETGRCLSCEGTEPVDENDHCPFSSVRLLSDCSPFRCSSWWYCPTASHSSWS